MTFRICTDCPIPHYDNCPDCFGFGIYTGQTEAIVPISASKAIDKTYPANWQPCPTCSSGPDGLPTVEEKATNPGDLADFLQRQAQAAALQKELVKILFNRAGLDRLMDTTDTDWQEAERQDANNEN